MEICAVAALSRTRPDRIAVAPPGSGFVIAHRRDHVVVDGPRFRHRVLYSFCLLRGKFPDDSPKRHALVWLQKALPLSRVHSCFRSDRLRTQPNPMLLPRRLTMDTHLLRRSMLRPRNLPTY